MNVALLIMGAWLLGLGSVCALRAMRAGQIKTLWADSWTRPIARQTLPLLFWIGVAIYVVLIVAGIILSAIAITGLSNT